jgi:hypothetical protein
VVIQKQIDGFENFPGPPPDNFRPGRRFEYSNRIFNISRFRDNVRKGQVSRHAGLSVLAVILVLAGPLVAAPPRDVFQDLVVPPNCDSSQAKALNNAGLVAGFGIQAYPLSIYDHAFLKNYGQSMQDLSTWQDILLFHNLL